MKADVFPGTESIDARLLQRAERLLPYFVLAVLWLFLLDQLGRQWWGDSQYSYGFFVPFLSLYLFSLRWESRGPARPSRRPGLTLFLTAMLAALMLPLRLLGESNPEWRMVSGILCAVVVGISVCLVAYRAGGSWAWHFLFPVAFIFAAVPWPQTFEGNLIKAMMELDASVAVKGLQWLGVPAVRQGGLIRLGATVVGVNEACSGIRSLQTTWMISLFLGELWRMTILRRIVLVASGFLIGFICNLGRIFFLLWLTERSGASAMESWHNTAGLAVLSASTVALWAVASRLRALSRPMPAAAAEAPPGRNALRPWPVNFLAVLGAWLILIPILVEVWYRTGGPARHAVMWTFDWPRETAIREEPIPESTHEILRNTDGSHAMWIDDNGVQWSGYFIRWAASTNGYNLARPHQPQLCLSAAGLKLAEDDGVRIYDIKGLRIPFHCFLFTRDQMSMRVWYTLWDDDTGASMRIAETGFSLASRIGAVRDRRRGFGEQSLEIGMIGSQPLADAESAFVRLLGRSLKLPQ